MLRRPKNPAYCTKTYAQALAYYRTVHDAYALATRDLDALRTIPPDQRSKQEQARLRAAETILSTKIPSYV